MVSNIPLQVISASLSRFASSREGPGHVPWACPGDMLKAGHVSWACPGCVLECVLDCVLAVSPCVLGCVLYVCPTLTPRKAP